MTRPRAVSNSDGYRVSYGYGTSTALIKSYEQGVADWMTIESVRASNEAVAVCTGSSCPAPNSIWPSVRYTWNTANTIETTTDTLGNTSSLTYDSAGRITGVRPASSSSNTITIAYDGNNQIGRAHV